MGPLVSTIPDLKSLVGRRIRVTREFSWIPTSTHGVIVDYSPTGYDGHEAITIAWMRPKDHLTNCPIWNDGQCLSNNDHRIAPGKCHPLRDDFGRDDHHDETQWLELLEK